MGERIELFSSRERKKRQETEPVFLQYDDFPQEFRVKVAHLFHEAFPWNQEFYGSISDENAFWKSVNQLLKARHGQLDLSPNDHIAPTKWRGYLLRQEEPAKILETIEVPLKIAVRRSMSSEKRLREWLQFLRRVLDRLDEIFYEHDLGYQTMPIARGDTIDIDIVRSDSAHIHSEVVEPAYHALHGFGYPGPMQEFLKALSEQRQGDLKTAVNEAHKAVESTMQSICADLGLQGYEGLTSKELLDLLIENEVIPRQSESFFTGVRQILQSGTPTIRNKQAAHGQGKEIVEMTPYSAAFALNIAASSILFLVAACQDKKANVEQKAT